MIVSYESPMSLFFESNLSRYDRRDKQPHNLKCARDYLPCDVVFVTETCLCCRAIRKDANHFDSAQRSALG